MGGRVVSQLYDCAQIRAGEKGAERFQNHLRRVNQSARNWITPRNLVIAGILLVGIFERVWEFGSLPPSLNPDEVSSGVDAFSLYRFGVDRNAVSFPVHFISWGGGQNALYAYLMIPFIALGGLTPITVRLPMLITGLLSLPLVYYIAKRTMGEKAALFALFLVAISPWHIMLSRWGLESNLLPFVFLIAYASLLKSELHNRWFIISGLFFGVSLYAYGTAYVAAPFMLGCGTLVLLRWGRVHWKNLLLGLAGFTVVGLPIALFVLINSLELESIHLRFITIPRLVGTPRYETVSLIFGGNFQALAYNLRSFLVLLWGQSDGLIWNTIESYGYLYKVTFPIAVIGLMRLVKERRAAYPVERTLLLAWLAAGLALGLLQPANINRVNIIFVPLILCTAFAVDWIPARLKVVNLVVVLTFLAGLALFTRDYHAEVYRREAAASFFSGLLPALDLARQTDQSPICVTKDVNMPYIYVLFVEQMNPLEYRRDIEYVNPRGRFREVRSLGRYVFGPNNCPPDPETVYVLRGEPAPENSESYKVTDFGGFHVYIPQN
jgi:hypothetical protein